MQTTDVNLQIRDFNNQFAKVVEENEENVPNLTQKIFEQFGRVCESERNRKGFSFKASLGIGTETNRFLSFYEKYLKTHKLDVKTSVEIIDVIHEKLGNCHSEQERIIREFEAVIEDSVEVKSTQPRDEQPIREISDPIQKQIQELEKGIDKQIPNQVPRVHKTRFGNKWALPTFMTGITVALSVGVVLSFFVIPLALPWTIPLVLVPALLTLPFYYPATLQARNSDSVDLLEDLRKLQLKLSQEETRQKIAERLKLLSEDKYKVVVEKMNDSAWLQNKKNAKFYSLLSGWLELKPRLITQDKIDIENALIKFCRVT